MLSLRAGSLLSSFALAASGLAVFAVAPSASGEVIPTTDLADCVPAGPRPCVDSFTREGGDPGDIEYISQLYSFDGATYVDFFAFGPDGFELGAGAVGDTFSVTLDLGTAPIPRVVVGRGQNVTVNRTNDSGNYTLTVTGDAVSTSGSCYTGVWPWRCPEKGLTDGGNVPLNENEERKAVFDVEVSDFGQWTDVPSRKAIYGLDFFSNIAGRSVPPEITTDGATETDYLLLRLANRRFKDNGSLFHGTAELRIPNSFLRLAYGVPNPELMTGSSLDVSGAGGGTAVTVTQEAGNDAMVVDISSMEFADIGAPARPAAARAARSAKLVKIKRGAIKPTRPTLTKAKRLTAGKANITFDKAKARGAKIRGYEVRCTSGGLTNVVSGKFPTVTVLGLKAGKGYDCQVRAKSKAGKGKYSVPKHLAARP